MPLKIRQNNRHYSSVIKPECLHGAGTLILTKRKTLKTSKKKDRPIFRHILGPKHTD